MKILFLSRWYPYPPNNGSKIRIFNMLDGLCRTHDVTLLSFFDPENGAPNGPLPVDRPVKIDVVPYREFESNSVRARLGLLSGTPRFLLDTYSKEMARMIWRAVQADNYDLVIASQLVMASYRDCFKGVPAIFDEVELGLFRPEASPASLPGWLIRRKLRWAKYRRYVARTLKGFRACTVASEAERRLLRAAAPGNTPVEVVPNSVDVDACDNVRLQKTPNSIVFAGPLRYAANYDAAAWFLEKVYPSIRSDIGGIHLTLTGDPGPYPPLAGPGVCVTGCVSDVRPLVASSAVSVAPIRMGGGTRLKILEAMALRTAVVTTSKGVEGLDARHGDNVLIADSPEEFAQCVVFLLRNPERAKTLAENAYGLVRTQYGSRSMASRMLALVDLATRRPAAETDGSLTPETSKRQSLG